MKAPDPAMHPILARHYGTLGPPNEERRRVEAAASRSLLGGENSRSTYDIEAAIATATNDNVQSLSAHWFAKVCEQFPGLADRIAARGRADEVVVSNIWALGVNPDTWHVSFRDAGHGFIIDGRMDELTARLGRLSYVLSFDNPAGAFRFAEMLAGHVGASVIDWTNDYDDPAPSGGVAA